MPGGESGEKEQSWERKCLALHQPWLLCAAFGVRAI